MKRFLEMSRAPFFTAIITPALFGAVLAWRETGTMDFRLLGLTLLGLIAAHAGSNLINDYFDFKLGADQNNPNRNKFSGGSGRLVTGKERAGTFLLAAIGSFLVAAAAGLGILFLMEQGRELILLIAAAGGLMALFYTAPPLKLAYRGLGEPCILMSFGVLPVLGAYGVQTGHGSLTVAAAGLPLALLITNIIWINEFPDHDSDKAAGKNHLVVILGTARARVGYHLILAAAAVSLLVLVFQGTLPGLVLLALAGLVPGAIAARILHANHDRPQALEPAQGMTIISHLVTGLVLIGTLIAA